MIMQGFRRSDSIFYYSIFVVSVALYLLGLYLYIFGDGYVSVEYVSIFFIFFVYFVILVKGPELFIFGFYCFYTFIVALPSLYLLFRGVYVQELKLFSFPVPLFSVLQLYVLISFFVFRFFFRGWKNNSAKQEVDLRNSSWKIVLISTACFMMVSCFVFVFINGITFGDRFDVLARLDPLSRIYIDNLGFLFFLLFFSTGVMRGFKYYFLAFVAGVSSFFVLYSVGVKFSGYVFYMFLGIFSFVLAAGLNRRMVVVALLSLSCFSIVLIFTLVFKNYEMSGAASGMDEALVRLTGQGQLFWATMAEMEMVNDPIFVWDQLKDFFSVGSNSFDQGGIVVLMDRFAPAEIFLDYRERGVVFTFGYPAAVMYIFGILFAPFVHLLIMVIYVLSLRLVMGYAVKMCGLPIVFQVLFIFFFVKFISVGVRFITNGDLFESFKLFFIFTVLFVMAKFRFYLHINGFDRVAHNPGGCKDGF